MAPNLIKFTGFGDLHGPKPHKFIGSGDIHGYVFGPRLSQRDPEVVVWQIVVLEAWGTTAKKLHIFWKRVVVWRCRLRRQGPKTITFLKMCGLFGLGTAGLQKTFGQHNFGIPLTQVRC